MSDAKFTLHSLEDIQAWPDPSWIIEDILAKDSNAQIVGKWGSGKTFIALDWGLSIAAGVPWGGKHPVKQGGVLYVFGEGKPGVKQRINAWFDHYGVDPTGLPFRAVPMPLQLADMNDVNKFVEDVDTQMKEDLQLIIFDTLARMIVGVDEDKSAGMGIVVNSLDYLRRGYGATMLVVHHTGHTNTKRGRGSSAVPAGFDTEILTTKKDDSRIVTLECNKMKDGDQFEPFGVTLVDSKQKTTKGKPASLVSVLGGKIPAEDPLQALNRSQNSKTLLAYMVEERPMGETYTNLREENVISDGSFHRTITKLLELGYVRRNGPLHEPTDQACKLFDGKQFN